MDRILELVRALEPETAAPSVEVRARQRELLLRSMVPADEAPARPRRWRPRHRGWFVTIAGAAAAAAVAVIVLPGRSSSPPAPSPAPGTSVVLTAVRRALANTTEDVLEVRSTASGARLSATSWVDLATGACRTDTSVDGQRSLTLFDEDGSAVLIDYGKKEWWTRGSGGVTCEPLLTPQAIERDVTTGQYTVAGHAVLDGQPSLKLVSTTRSSGLHPTTKLTTLWVNATTYLPIQSTSTDHLTEQAVFTWMPATATNTAVLDVTVPPGFRQVAPPPTQVQLVPGSA